MRAIASEERLAISAGTLAEALIVAQGKRLEADVAALIYLIAAEVAPLTRERTQDAAAAHALWGKGRHPAKLNFGDCFAYALAKEYDCPLLFIGNDFAQTDIVSALAAGE